MLGGAACGAAVCGADAFFVTAEGEYRFEAGLLAEAHQV